MSPVATCENERSCYAWPPAALLLLGRGVFTAEDDGYSYIINIIVASLPLSLNLPAGRQGYRGQCLA